MSRYQFTENYESESWARTRRELETELVLARAQEKKIGGQKIPDEVRIAPLTSNDPEDRELLRLADLEAAASKEERRAMDEAADIVRRHPGVFEPVAKRTR